jgi:hypothetical protein
MILTVIIVLFAALGLYLGASVIAAFVITKRREEAWNGSCARYSPSEYKRLVGPIDKIQ